MKRVQKNEGLLALLWVGTICGLAFWWQLGSTGLVDETEPLFAEAARGMWVSGDWVTPYYNEATRFDKPPLIYWLMAVSYQALGLNTWAARLPSAASATVVVAASFYVLRRFGNGPHSSAQERWQAALLGSGAIALNMLALVWARTGVSDMLLTGCIAIALLSFFVGYVAREEAGFPTVSGWLPANRWYWLGYGCLALGVLAKGPVAIVLPGLVVMGFAAWTGQFSGVMRELGLPGGGVLFGLLAVPWYVLVVRAHGSDYTETFFGYHNVDRFTSVVNGHAAPWYFYFAVVLVGFAPLSVYVPVAIARLQVWKRRAWGRQPRSAQLGLFAGCWFAGVFVFFTAAATKLPSYVLPLVPAAGMLVALLWLERPGWGRRAAGIANVLLLAVLAGAVWLLPAWLGYDPSAPELGDRLRRTAIPAAGAGVWALGAIAVGWLVWRDRWDGVWRANLLAMAVFVAVAVLPAYQLVDAVRQQPLRELAALQAQLGRPGEELWMLGHEKPTLVFYAGRPVAFHRRPRHAIAAIAARLEREPSLVLLAIGHPGRVDDLEDVAVRWEVLGERGAYQLVRVAIDRRSLARAEDD